MRRRDQLDRGAGLLGVAQIELCARKSVLGAKPTRRTGSTLAGHEPPLFDCGLLAVAAATREHNGQIFLRLSVAGILHC